MPNTKNREYLEYTQSMLREIRNMAEANRDVMLAYFVEMAYIEACDLLRASHKSAKDDASGSNLVA